MADLNYDQREKIYEERGLSVYKRDDMIQRARFKLSVQEQRAVLYAISKIKPEDKAFNEYIFEIKDFYNLCGIEDKSYTRLKAILKGLADKSWWATIDDKGTESVVRWFSTVRTNKKSGKVIIKFHEDMMPFLLDLAEQQKYFTSYNLKYILAMSSKHSPRLYEILKSYQKNNNQWFFEIETLKKLMDCENYKRWPDFRRYALEPAVEEINKYTDICITYNVKKEGRKITRVVFYMDDKTGHELAAAGHEIIEVLDGQIDIFALLEEDEGRQFLRNRYNIHEQEKQRIEEQKRNIKKGWLDPEE